MQQSGRMCRTVFFNPALAEWIKQQSTTIQSSVVCRQVSHILICEILYPVHHVFIFVFYLTGLVTF
jgi:hypothetical protein